jgi:hypothetical protein
MIRRRDKMIFTFSLLLINSIIFLLIYGGPARGYEISIYNSYPNYFWFLIILTLILGLFLITESALVSFIPSSGRLGLIVIFYVNLLILLIPLIRGYETYGRADVLSHIGFSKDIIITGHLFYYDLNFLNYYPANHIIMAFLKFASDLDLGILAMVYPLIIRILFIIFLYLFSRELSGNPQYYYLSLAFGALLLYRTENLMLAPSVQCFFLLPLVLLLYLKSIKKSDNAVTYKFLLIISLLIIPFFHPGEGSMILIIILIIHELYYVLESRSKKSKISVTFGSVFILLITWFLWLSTSSIFFIKLKKIFIWMANELGSIDKSTLGSTNELVTVTGMNLFSLIELIFKYFGQNIVMFILSFFFCLFLLRETRIEKNNYNLHLVLINFILLAILMIFFFLFDLGIGFAREMRYVTFFSAILNGYSICYFSERFNNKPFFVFLIMLILIIITSFSLLNTFPSAYNKEPNVQVTKMELTGMSWFLEHRNTTLSLDSKIGREIRRMIQPLIGTFGAVNCSIDIRTTPNHFDYLNSSYYGQEFDDDAYFIDFKAHRIIFQEIIPEYKSLWRFFPEDYYYFDHHDKTVNRIYANSEFWTYFIQSIK